MKIAILAPIQYKEFKNELKLSTVPNISCFAWYLAEHLAKLPHTDVHFITIDPLIRKDQIIAKGKIVTHLLHIPSKMRFLTLFQYCRIKINKVLREIQPDMIDAHGTEHEYPYIAIRSGYPYIVHLQNCIAELLRRGFLKKNIKGIIIYLFEKYCLKNARYLTGQTPWLRKIVKDKIIGEFVVKDISINSLFFDVTNNNKGNDILFIGRISPEKGIDFLIDSFKKVVKNNKTAKLKIVGSCRKTNQDYLSKLQKKIDDNRLASNVEFLGPKTSFECADELSRSSFLVTPSLFEPFGLVLAEAMATGTPVIATRVGGIPYVVEDGKTGFLVEPGNVDALAEKILLLLQDRDLRRQMGQRGKQEAMQRFHSDVVARKTMEVYEKVIADWQG